MKCLRFVISHIWSIVGGAQRTEFTRLVIRKSWNRSFVRKICSQLEDRTSCERWILCVYGHELPQKCAPGTAFNPALGTCDLAQNVRCALDTCLHVEGGIGLAPAPDNCYDYFYCFNNEKLFRGHCSPGLAFDSITRGCVRRGQETCFAVGASVPRANVPRAQVAIRQ